MPGNFGGFALCSEEAPTRLDAREDDRDDIVAVCDTAQRDLDSLTQLPAADGRLSSLQKILCWLSRLAAAHGGSLLVDRAMEDGTYPPGLVTTKALVGTYGGSLCIGDRNLPPNKLFF